MIYTNDYIMLFSSFKENILAPYYIYSIQKSIGYYVYNFDNGPDYLTESLMRIVVDGKSGFINRSARERPLYDIEKLPPKG